MIYFPSLQTRCAHKNLNHTGIWWRCHIKSGSQHCVIRVSSSIRKREWVSVATFKLLSDRGCSKRTYTVIKEVNKLQQEMSQEFWARGIVNQSAAGKVHEIPFVGLTSNHQNLQRQKSSVLHQEAFAVDTEEIDKFHDLQSWEEEFLLQSADQEAPSITVCNPAGTTSSVNSTTSL